MAQADVWRKYLEAGMALSQITQAKADALVRELVRAGELRAAEAQEWITLLLERSRHDAEALRALVQDEVTAALDARQFVSRTDLDALEARLLAAAAAAAATPRRAPAKKAAARKAPAATKAAATKAPARKASAKKAPAKKAPTKKAPAARTARARRPPTSS